MSWFFVLLSVLLVAVCVVGFYGYWQMWSMAWSYAWPSGPAWFVTPSLVSFYAICFTSVIITLMILRGGTR
jgi:hypothetical protein